MPTDVPRNFSTAGGVAHMDCSLQIKLFSEGGEIVGVSVHLVAIPRLSGTAVASPVVRDHTIAALAEIQHLSIPVVRSERPSVAEHNGLARSPVLVENLSAVFDGDCRHELLSLNEILFPLQSDEQKCAIKRPARVRREIS